MAGKNVMKTLTQLNGPATMKEIVSLIASHEQVEEKDIKDEIVETLQNGVRYGFLKRTRGRYYVEQFDHDSLESLVLKMSTRSRLDNRRSSRSQGRRAEPLYNDDYRSQSSHRERRH